jgi:hypothetical protein
MKIVIVSSKNNFNRNNYFSVHEGKSAVLIFRTTDIQPIVIKMLLMHKEYKNENLKIEPIQNNYQCIISSNLQ